LRGQALNFHSQQVSVSVKTCPGMTKATSIAGDARTGRILDAMQRETPLRRAGTYPRGWTPDQQRITPRRVARCAASGERIARGVFELKCRYFPSVSTFRFSSSFIFLIAGSRLTSPVVCVAAGGGLLLGIDVWPVGTAAGRVAVVLGVELFCAMAGWAFKKMAPDSRVAASARGVIERVIVGFMFIGLLLSDR